MASVGVLLLLICLSTLLSFPQTNASYNPVPNSAALVSVTTVRFTVLTPNLIRLEYDPHSKFDDRPTIHVVNRNLPVPKFTVTRPDNGSVTIKTDTLTLTYSGGGGVDMCSSAQTNTDITSGERVPQYPDGIDASSQDECCKTCEKTSQCIVWIYEPSKKRSQEGINCWLMQSFGGTKPATDRVLGGNSGFTPQNLQIHYSGNGVSVDWKPGTQNTGNLLGSLSALDCYSTKEECYEDYVKKMREGLISRDGWYLLSDSDTARFDATVTDFGAPEIPWWTNERYDTNDWYFLAYGNDYRQGIQEYGLIGGTPTLPPRSAFGVWWSRYYAYSQQQFIDEVLTGYAQNKIPLSHVVLDMDWHTEPKETGCNSWGGYTFNTQLFPNPPQFIDWLHGDSNTVGHPLKISLNIHPQTGVDHCQANYPQFAQRMGVDPSTKQTIKCDFGNKTWATALFDVFLDATPLTNVDSWWTDYGGCGGPSGEALFWSNYYFDYHIKAYRNSRPLVLSRNGGLGNHRYPVGFSGDTFQAFITLQWEIEMTQTAANVLFAYWSHDIGGFHDGKGSPGDANPKNLTGSEMLMRWIQFGAVSPILRTHCNHCERRIWLFPHYLWMREAMVLRNALLPYIYSWAKMETYDKGLALVHPMYWNYPTANDAYNNSKEQYMFGDNIIASPISHVSDHSTNMTRKSVWIPDGTWWSWDGKESITGPKTYTANYGFGDIPLFVKEGTIIPMQNIDSVGRSYSDPLMWSIWPGSGDVTGVVYEDDGNSLGYGVKGAFSTIEAHFSTTSNEMKLVIDPAKGSWSGMPKSRKMQVQVRGFAVSHPNGPQKVTVNGQTIPKGESGWTIPTEYGLAITPNSLFINAGTLSTTGTNTILISI